LKGIRESIEKSSSDAAAALASSRNNQPTVQLVERQSQTVITNSQEFSPHCSHTTNFFSF